MTSGQNTKNSASKKIDENLARWKRARDLPTFNRVPVDLLLEGEVQVIEREVVSESEHEKQQQPFKKKRRTVATMRGTGSHCS